MWQQLRWADLYFSIVKFSQDVAFQKLLKSVDISRIRLKDKGEDSSETYDVWCDKFVAHSYNTTDIPQPACITECVLYGITYHMHHSVTYYSLLSASETAR